MTMLERRALETRMRALFDQWRSSGESIVAFSKRHGITPWKFQYWRGRFGRGGRSKNARFAPVRLVNDVASYDGYVIEVALSSGETIRVGSNASLEMLRGVLSVLRDRC
jgi:hypothetical protein